MKQYEVSNEVEIIAKSLVNSDDQLAHLHGAHFLYYIAADPPKEETTQQRIDRERKILLEREPGVIKKMPDLWAFDRYGQDETGVVIVMEAVHWEAMNSEEKTQAIHELLCSVEFDGFKIKINKPEFKGFFHNLEAYPDSVAFEKLRRYFRKLEEKERKQPELPNSRAKRKATAKKASRSSVRT